MRRTLVGFVVTLIALLALVACGSKKAEVVAPATSSTTTSTSTTTTVLPATTVSTTTSTTSTTTTIQPTTTSTVAEKEEEIAFTSNLGSCDFSSQPLPDPATPAGSIRIDSIDLNEPLLSGLRKEMEAPAYCVGSAVLGQPGFSIIGGHRTSHGGPFRYLPGLKDGDLIVVTFGGIEYQYAVRGTPELYLETDASKVLQGASSRNILKLFTCGPNPGESTSRWIVTAKLVG